MPKISNSRKARIFNVSAARNIAVHHIDTNGEEEDDDTIPKGMEPLTSIVYLPSESETPLHRGYDDMSSTKDIYKHLEKEVERERTNGDDVHEDYKATRKRQRYQGSLKAYDNISDEDILHKYAGTNRTGSKMYKYEVFICVASLTKQV